MLITGLGEELPAGFEMYPNPVSSFLFIENQDLDNSIIDIMDIRGSVIQQHKASGSKQKISVESLNSGTYLLRARNEERTVVLKFIKE